MSAVIKALSSKLGSPKKAGKEYDFPCPFCHLAGIHPPSTLHVNVTKRGWFGGKLYNGAACCHKCDYRTRSVYNLLRDVLGRVPRTVLRRQHQTDDFVKLVEEIFRQPGRSAPKPVLLPDDFRRLHTPPRRVMAKMLYSWLTGPRPYGRRLTDDDIDDWGIGYCISGLYRGHVVFPLYMSGEVVYFTTRAFLSGTPKSLHPSGSRDHLLFGYDRASVVDDWVAVVEGPMDAIAFGVRGIALLGQSLSARQIRLLSRIRASEIVVALDADSVDRSIVLAAKLSEATNKRVSYIPFDNGDPDDHRDTLDVWYKRRLQSKGFVDEVRATLLKTTK